MKLTKVRAPKLPRPKLNLDSWSKTFLVLSVLTCLPQVVLLQLYLKSLPPLVPLFFSLPWGLPRLVEPIWLWILPALSIGVLIINFLGSHLLGEIVLTRVLGAAAFLVTLLSLITLIKIILLGLP